MLKFKNLISDGKASKESPGVYFEVTFMQGDADHYESNDLYIPLDHIDLVDQLTDVLIKIKQMDTDNWNGRRKWGILTEIPNFKKFFYDPYGDDDTNTGEYSMPWIYDADSQCHSAYDSVKVYVITSDGEKINYHLKGIHE